MVTVAVHRFAALLVLAACQRFESYRPTPGGRVYELRCDEVRTVYRTEDTPSRASGYHSEDTNTYWSGTVPGLRVDVRRVPRITAYTCGRERFSQGPDCPSNSTCTETGETLNSDCEVVRAVVTDDGRVVIPCGERRTRITRFTSRDDQFPLHDAGPPTPWISGYRHRHAYVRIE